MKYRKFGKLDWDVSALGFGAMRLPIIEGNNANVNEDLAIRMIRYSIDHGVNYVDTAYTYHSGNSERCVGKALKDGYRGKVKLATKLPARFVNSAPDFDRLFNEQLGRLEVEKVDFYLLHGLNERTWPKIRDLGVLKWAEDKISSGRISHLGFSFHDSYKIFKQIIDDYSGWDFCQVQYNYMDIEEQAGRKGVEYAAGKGLGIVVMEPLRGGKLAGNFPEKVQKVWDIADRSKNQVEMAFLWVWGQSEVSLALSGMSTMQQVIQNVDIAGRLGNGALTQDELTLISRVRETYKDLAPIPCTSCEYCQPCPNGVAIPRIFTIYNEANIYNDINRAKLRYKGGPQELVDSQRADQCLECGECLDACPQKIPITDWLKKIHDELSSK